MCELFGFSGREPENVTGALREFVTHSREHPHGWGLARVTDQGLLLDKEPVRAKDSPKLREILEGEVISPMVIGHIRKATVGNIALKNCHPWSAWDFSGRRWTLAHNGTIFKFPAMDPYYKYSDSDTDSACLLSYLLSRMSREYLRLDAMLDQTQRFALLDQIIQEAAPNNKLNLLIYDGELFYVHTNLEGTLFRRQTEQGVIFSTQPLSVGDWEPVPQTQLLAYRQGTLAFQGTQHGCAYREDPEQMRLLYLSYAAL